MHAPLSKPLRLAICTALTGLTMAGALAPRAAQAREVADCQQAWGQAVRSYLTQNRTKGPEDETFKPACEIEAKGDKPAARVEAVLIGVQALVRLDPSGCTHFLESYARSSEPQKICAQAGSGGEGDTLRRLIANSLPPPGEVKAVKRAPRVKKP